MRPPSNSDGGERETEWTFLSLSPILERHLLLILPGVLSEGGRRNDFPALASSYFTGKVRKEGRKSTQKTGGGSRGKTTTANFHPLHFFFFFPWFRERERERKTMQDMNQVQQQTKQREKTGVSFLLPYTFLPLMLHAALFAGRAFVANMNVAFVVASRRVRCKVHVVLVCNRFC